MQAPTHPGRQTQQQAPQQGLGAPVAQSNANPYFVPNQVLAGSAAKLQAAQAQQAQAQAQKAQAEAAILQQAQGLTPPSPEEVQLGQLTDGIVRGQIAPEQLQGLVQAGEVLPEIADMAMQNAQQYMAQDQAVMESQMNQGLGSFQ